MSRDVHKAILPELKTALAAIPTQAIPPISPVPPERVFDNYRTSTAPFPHVWIHADNTSADLAIYQDRMLCTLTLEGWGRNRDEAYAIEQCFKSTIANTDVTSYGTAGLIEYSYQSTITLTDGPTEHHVAVTYLVWYSEAAVRAV